MPVEWACIVRKAAAKDRLMANALDPIVSERWLLVGSVQGRGLRPEVARLAGRREIAGSVRNTNRGVEIVALGNREQLDAFSAEVSRVFNARLVRKQSKFADTQLNAGFRIIASGSGERLETNVPLDVAICQECIDEFENTTNRRQDHGLISCASCGPRYSILKKMPFDREYTSMHAFPLCRSCCIEFAELQNRRFHAQTISCPDCGPTCWATDGEAIRLGEGTTAIDEVARQIKQGKIAAVLGIGGYQLICDAENDLAVMELRRRKKRPAKPLPVMVRDLNEALRVGEFSKFEKAALTEPANPIVLVRQRLRNRLALSLAPGLQTLGIMLPTTPIHWQLLKMVGTPIVVTSGNLHGAPIRYQIENAIEELGGIADVFLHHNRRIVRPIDDSVVQCCGHRVMVLRAGRGLAPMAFEYDSTCGTVGGGGQQKVAVAISTGSRLVLSPHIGEMDSELGRIRFEDAVAGLSALYGFETRSIACDTHPDYFTTHWAKKQTSQAWEVQHHHAHVAASMLEHQLLGTTVLGIAFDGSGLGDDGTIWGGEFLIASDVAAQRVGHLRSFRLPGGEIAIKQPWRVALSLLLELKEHAFVSDWLKKLPMVLSLSAGIAAAGHGPWTSSMGRLFDAVASIVLGIDYVSFEGEAAMRLESVCDKSEGGYYAFTTKASDPWQLDWTPVLQAMLGDLNRITSGQIAMRFHRTVADAILTVAERYRMLPCLLTGGVFQNKTLLELLSEGAAERGIDIRFPGRIPINDGGLAVGQVIVANARQRRGERCV